MWRGMKIINLNVASKMNTKEEWCFMSAVLTSKRNFNRKIYGPIRYLSKRFTKSAVI
jgi:hypothetical protein